MKTLLAAIGIALACILPAHAGKLELDGSLSDLRFGKNSASTTITVINKSGKPIARANFVCSLITEDMTPYASQTVQFLDLPKGGKVRKKITFRDAGAEYAYSAVCDPVGVFTADMF